MTEWHHENCLSFEHVRRPPVFHGEINTKKLRLAVSDCSYRMIPLSEVPPNLLLDEQKWMEDNDTYAPWYGKVPVVDIYGVTPAVSSDERQSTSGSNSVKITVYGMQPHFSVSASARAVESPDQLCRVVKDRLQLLLNGLDPDSPDSGVQEKIRIYNESLRYLLPNEDRSKYDVQYEHTAAYKGFQPFVSKVEWYMARTIYGFRTKDSLFLKIHLISPKDVPKARAFFQGSDYMKFAQPQYGNICKTFESNVEFVNRCTIDRDIKGMHWMEVDLHRGSTRVGIESRGMRVKEYPVLLEPHMENELNEKLETIAPIYIKSLLRGYGLTRSESSCQIELDVMGEDIRGITQDPELQNVLPPARILSLDIEAANSVIGMFPSPTNPGDEVIIIGSLLYELGKAKKPIEGSIFIIGEMDEMDSSELEELKLKWGIESDRLHIYRYDNERLLLFGFKEYLVQSDPDILTGYNILGFDMEFLCNRAKFLGMKPDEWDCFGRMSNNPVYLRKCTFQSNAYGRKDFKVPVISGRSLLDAQETVMRDYTCKFTSYKLDNVAKRILNVGKKDVPYWLITPYFRRGGLAKRKVAIYCLVDALLPAHVLERKGHDNLYVNNARLYGVSLTDLVLRGQQKRGYCFMLSFLRQHYLDKGILYVVPFNRIVKNESVTGLEISHEKNKKKAQYSGATVIEPKRGYYSSPVATLDFASLYPSLMMAHNLCYSTLIPPHLARRYVEGVHKFTSPEGDSFISEHIMKGIFPLMLEQLLSRRKQAKIKMNNAKDPVEAAMYDSMQLALKLGANSLYGFTGAGVGTLPCFPVARAVTSWGRHYIEKTKEFIEDLESVGDMIRYPPGKMTRKRVDPLTGSIEAYLPYLVVYGDSVTGDTPLLIKDGATGSISWKRIDSFVPEHEFEETHHDKEQVEFLWSGSEPQYQVWSECGWTPVKRCIRHKCRKNIYRVVTHTGVVDVTEDHSLLDINGEELTPKDVCVGSKLLHHSPLSGISIGARPSFSVKEAFAMGAFFADGSCGEYNYKSVKKYSWAINKQDRAFLEACAEALPFDTKILETMQSSHVFKLVPDAKRKRGFIRDIVRRYRALFYNEHKQKRVPPELLTAPIEYVEPFFNGFYAGDGSKKESCTRFCQKGKETCAGLMLLAQRLGWKTSINTLTDKPDIFRITLTRGKQRTDSDIVKKIQLLRQAGEEEYVYDLETENHHFHVGPGDMIVHNTDSVMILFTNLSSDDMTEALRQAEIINKMCNQTCYPNGIVLEMEKGYCPYLLLRKKGYVGGYWTCSKVKEVKSGVVQDVAVMNKIDAKGLISVRRDNAPIQRDLMKRVQSIIMGVSNGWEKETVQGYEEVLRDGKSRPFTRVVRTEITEERALIEIRETVQAMYDNDIPLSEYVITKALSRREEDYFNLQPHVKVNQDIRRRNPGSEYPLGARIPYIVADTRNKKSTDNAQDPEYMIQERIPPDIPYYLERLKKPLIQALTPFLFQEEFMRASYLQVFKRFGRPEKYKHFVDFLNDEPAEDSSWAVAEALFPTSPPSPMTSSCGIQYEYDDIDDGGEDDFDDDNEDSISEFALESLYDDVEVFMEDDDDCVMKSLFEQFNATPFGPSSGTKRKVGLCLGTTGNGDDSALPPKKISSFEVMMSAARRLFKTEENIIAKTEKALFHGYRKPSNSGQIVRQKMMEDAATIRESKRQRSKIPGTISLKTSRGPSILKFITLPKHVKSRQECIEKEEEAMRDYIDWRKKVDAEKAGMASLSKDLDLEEQIYNDLVENPLLAKFAKAAKLIERLKDTKPGAARCLAYSFGPGMNDWIKENRCTHSDGTSHSLIWPAPVVPTPFTSDTEDEYIEVL